jgi:hypothetical protein
MNPKTIVRYYPLALWADIGFVIASVTLFAARGLGVLALAAKAPFFVAALACVAFMASIALRHHPLGCWS